MNGPLFIVDGASASGKSALQQYVKEFHPEISVILKATDRRREDKAAAGAYADQEVITRIDFDRRMEEPDFLWYEFSKYRYGFNISELERLLPSSGIFVIVRDINVIARLKVYGATRGFLAIPIYVLASEESRRQFLHSEGHSQEEINARISRDGLRYPMSRLRCPLYDIILDNDGGDLTTLYDKFEEIIFRYIKRPKQVNTVKG